MTLFAPSPVNGKISVCFSASTSIDLDHRLTAKGSLVPKLVIAMGRTYDQMPRRHDACGAGFQIGGCARLPLRECVPAGCPEPYLYDRFTSGSEVAMGFSLGGLRPLSPNLLFE